MLHYYKALEISKFFGPVILARLCFLGAALVALPACRSSDDSSVINDFKSTIADLSTKLDQRRQEVQNSSAAELHKLHSLEYKLIEIDASASSSDIEQNLAELGSERWDCFHIQPLDKTLRVFCKRSPKTFLKYIPRVF